MRLTQRGYDAGVVCDERYRKFAERRQRVRDGISTLKTFAMSSSEWKNAGYVPHARSRACVYGLCTLRGSPFIVVVRRDCILSGLITHWTVASRPRQTCCRTLASLLTVF